MGEVWRATDTKLGREVAIKLLPESVAADPTVWPAFKRATLVLASLNHSNIAGSTGSKSALIMELVDGPRARRHVGSGAGHSGNIIRRMRRLSEWGPRRHPQHLHRDDQRV
jgi:serine/threonine-protein kinase